MLVFAGFQLINQIFLDLDQILLLPLKVNVAEKAVFVKRGRTDVLADCLPFENVCSRRHRRLNHINFFRIAAKSKNNRYVVKHLAFVEASEERRLLIIHLKQEQVPSISSLHEFLLCNFLGLFLTDLVC